MVNNDHCVQVSEYCFNVCRALDHMQVKNEDELNESMRIALKDLEW